jgi:Transposase DDE domain group 1
LQKLGKEVVFRGDAAFAKPDIYEALEKRGVKYAIRIPANDSLERDIAELYAAGRKAEPQTSGLVQRLSVSGGQLEDSATGGGKGGVPCWGVVSPRGLHCDQLGDAQPSGSAVLQQTGGNLENGPVCRASGRTEMAVIVQRCEGGDLSVQSLQFSKSKWKFWLNISP